MAFEQLKAQIGILLGEMNDQPEDLHELYQQVHQELNQMRATGMDLPADLVELEQRLLAEFPGRSAAQGLSPPTAGLHPPSNHGKRPPAGDVAERLKATVC